MQEKKARPVALPSAEQPPDWAVFVLPACSVSPISARRLRYHRRRRRRRRPTAQIFVGLFSGNEHPKMVRPPLLFSTCCAKSSSTKA